MRNWVWILLVIILLVAFTYYLRPDLFSGILRMITPNKFIGTWEVNAPLVGSVGTITFDKDTVVSQGLFGTGVGTYTFTDTTLSITDTQGNTQSMPYRFMNDNALVITYGGYDIVMTRKS